MDVAEGVLVSELVTDSTTPQPPFDDLCDTSSLERLDRILKCQICYDYFDTCVITDCCHSFCSLCIRKYIQYKTECPLCFKELYDSSLKANRIVDDIVELFPDIKERFVKCVRVLNSRKPNSILPSPAKNVDPKSSKCSEPASSKNSAAQNTMTPAKSSSNLSTVAKPSGIQTPTAATERVLIPKMFLSPMKRGTPTVEKNATMQECPVCSVLVPDRNMNRHLDDCLQRGEKASKVKNSPPPVKRTPLPKLVFRLLKNNQLKSKAQEYGLSSHGDNETLKTRIQKYTALYNAECDKINPRPVSEIIRALEKEERTLAASQKLPKLTHLGDVTEKSKHNAQYLKENRDRFNLLIEKMKSQKAAAKPQYADDYCQPSTSKTHCDYVYDARNDDMLEVDEMKEEKTEVDSQNAAAAVASDRHSSEDDDVFNPTRRLRGKRLDFEDCPPETNRFDIDRVKLEPHVEIYEAATDDENDQSFGKDSDDEDDLSGSPVIKRSARRKRRATGISAKKPQRKKKR